MKVKIKEQYKSIKPPCEFELPDFSVLTGKNGSGKTHLLEALSNKKIVDITYKGRTIENVRYIGFNGLNPNIQEICDPEQITNHIKNVWKNLHNAKINLKNTGRTISKNEQILAFIEEKNRPFINKVLHDTGKFFTEIKEDDLADSFVISFMGQNDFFTAQFALIFKNYHKELEENKINAYYNAQGVESNKPILSSEDFKQKFGNPPWDFVNKILEETNIPYEVNNPLGTRLDSSFSFKLKDKINGFEIDSTDLSTGEKVLMSLALAIYNTGGYFGKPELLLIDEPDAALHPSMTHKMVSVLNKNIVQDNNIPTIITTHSPTTVIAAEGISIYQMVRGQCIPQKISTQKGIEVLSGEIPFLKISTEKRRQVFVESKFDVSYYERISNIFSRLESLPSEPIFIPARTSNGSNCTDVIDVVRNLSDNGNDQVYGIIDWDLTNNSGGKVLILGEKERYAIENYILDPLKMGLFFIRERKVNTAEFIGLTITTYSEVSNLTKSDAQIIIDKVLEDLGLNSLNKVKYKLYNGWEMEITTEFNKYNGHDLEQLYKQKFLFLNAYQREDKLKIEIIEKVMNDFPKLTPDNLFDILRKII